MKGSRDIFLDRLRKNFVKDGLLAHGSVLFAGLIGAQLCNMLFQAFMGRALWADDVKGIVEFGTLSAMLGLLNVVYMPLRVVSTALGRYTSLLVQQGRRGDVRRLLFKWLGLIGGGSIFLSLLFFVFAKEIAVFFHLDRVEPVWVAGAILAAVFCRSVSSGVLHGLQGFGPLSRTNFFGAFARLAGGALLVLCVAPFSEWGLLGHGLGYGLACGLGVWYALKLAGSVPASTKPLPRLRFYLAQSFFVVLGYAVLQTSDVVLVKHFFPNQAGEFACAATLGRLVVFLPQALAMAMFPKVVSDEVTTCSHRRVLGRTLLYTLLFTLAGALGLSFFTRLGLGLLFGIKSASGDLLLWTRLMGWVMIPVSLINVVIPFCLAQRRFLPLLVVPFGVAAYLLLVFFWCPDVTRLIMLLGGASLFLFCVSGLWTAILSCRSKNG